MDITVDHAVDFPRALVFETMRDKMPDLAPLLPNVDSIDVRERREPSPGVIELVNLWKAAKTEIPTVARPFVDQSKLNWIDRARWTQADWGCAWKLEVGFMPERVKCAGSTRYEEMGPERTMIRMRGKLELDLKGLLPGLIARSATPSVEAFIIKLVQPNFEKTIDALAQYLAHQKKA
ncbi:hypothetical protein L6V77_28260 [Myxococcota bacterium]|nr:hypothetical protein [Myxococcota bacterium]